MKQNDWTDKLRSRMADRKAPVPDDLWNRIEARLDEAQAADAVPETPVASGAPRRPRVVRMVVWALSAAAVVAVLVVVALCMNEDSIRQVASIESKVAQHRYRSVWPTYDGGLLVAKTASAVPSGNNSVGASDGMPCLTTKDDAVETMAANASEGDLATTARCETPRDDLEQVPPTAQNPMVQKSTASPQKRTPDNRPAYGIGELATHARRRGRWSVAVHADGVAIGSQNSQHPMLSVASNGMSYASSTGDDPMADYSDQTALKAYSPLMTEYSEKKHHARPVSVGLTMDMPLTQRVSLVTGVVYTSAVTDFISSVGNNEVVEKQKLHYIGVPLNVKVGVWSIGGLHTYVSSGAQADFNVAARLSSGGIDKDIKKDRPQFSIGAAAGVQYNIVNGLGMYAEPGVKYYIDNGSGLETIFKDKQFNFSLQLGLRYGF